MTARHSVAHPEGRTKWGQVSQEFTVVTAAPVRRTASALVTLALAGSGALLGGTAWADPTPAPGTSIDQPVPETSASEVPAVAPSIGTWIIGGTELEASSVTPAGKPAARPVAQPAAVPARTRTTHTHQSSTRGTIAPMAPDGATALPFTGGHVDALLPTGLALLVGGVALTLVSRPRATARC